MKLCSVTRNLLVRSNNTIIFTRFAPLKSRHASSIYCPSFSCPVSFFTCVPKINLSPSSRGAAHANFLRSQRILPRPLSSKYTQGQSPNPIVTMPSRFDLPEHRCVFCCNEDPRLHMRNLRCMRHRSNACTRESAQTGKHARF